LRATDRRSASKCQGKWPDQTLDQAFGLPEVLVAVSTSRLSCKRAGKTQTLMPVWDSSGESRFNRGGRQAAIILFSSASGGGAVRWLSVGYDAAANQGGTMFKTSLSRRSFWMVATWLLFVANSQIVSAQDRAAISLDPIAWTPIGPAPSVNGRTTFLENTSGRITAIVAHPTDPNVIYIGAAGGGVWKTIDGGSTWTPLTDAQSTLFIGAIALALSNPNVIY